MRCGKLFKTITKSNKAVCPNCCNSNGKIFRVRSAIYYSVHKDVEKYSKKGLKLSPDTIIEAYQKVIKKFKLTKEVGKIIHDGKDYR
jgi:predicted DNA-binding protein (UPF0278 family)